jgi:large subunit ribosomal protein L15
MDLSNLKPAVGSTKKVKRLGRGQGSGRGGTSTRGTKGAQSRASHKIKIGFEGGQMPLQRRVPKYGFKNFNRVEYVPINLVTLQVLHEKNGIDKFDPEVFKKFGLISKKSLVKILGRGELKAKLEVVAHSFSATAKESIEKKGGKAIKL